MEIRKSFYGEEMRVIVGCEFSQIVTMAFRKKGHEAYSCDLLPTEGNPQWHFQEDILKVLESEKFDLGIFHPPCTYLANSGVQHLHKDKSRWQLMYSARDFFLQLLNAPIKKVCVENPVPHKYARLPEYNQIIQPYQYGHTVSKKTCLWLKGLPPLKPTKIVDKGERYIGKDGKPNGSKWYQLSPSKDRWKYRSRTFQGIAEALAEQWNFY